MSESILVSICCITYNHAPYIKTCLDGFLNQQTDFRFEILIHDDCSTDGTTAIIKEYESQYPDIIKPIYEKENQYKKGGPFGSIIWNFPRASGTYLALCEGDDYWTDPHKLQKQVDFLEQHKDFVMCCTAFTQSFNGNENEKATVLFDLDEITIDDILREQWIGTLTTLFRKDAINDYVTPFDNLPMGDLPLWGHLALKGRIKYIKDVTSNYRSLENSACHFKEEDKQFAFGLSAMRVREYYAIKAHRLSVAQPYFSKKAHYYLDRLFVNRWKGVPTDELWHFVKEYGNPSGYDKLKYWGMKSDFNYFISHLILRMKKKI